MNRPIRMALRDQSLGPRFSSAWSSFVGQAARYEDSWPTTTEKFQISGWNSGDQGSASNQTAGGQSIILLRYARESFCLRWRT